MSAYKSDFLQVLAARGFIHQISDAEGLDAKAQAGAITAYVGFDCHRPSLHIGNLLTIMMLRWLQKTGNRPIALMGGGTTQDRRSFAARTKPHAPRRATDRREHSRHPQVFARFLDFGDGPTARSWSNNADWLDHLHYIAFLRDVGRHFSVNRC